MNRNALGPERERERERERDEISQIGEGGRFILLPLPCLEEERRSFCKIDPLHHLLMGGGRRGGRRK